MYFCNETLSRKKAARDNRKPSQKISQNLTQNANFSRIKITFLYSQSN